MRIAILGVGLIGGSIGLAARQRLDAEDRAVLRVSRALQRRHGGKIVARGSP